MPTADLPNGAGGDARGIRQRESSDLPQRPIVLKFGGTSSITLPDPPLSELTRGSRAASRQSKIAVVCSARSGVSKAGGTTNRLFKAIRYAVLQKSSNGYRHILSKLHEEHVSATECISSQKIRNNLVDDISIEFQKLTQTLDLMPETPKVDPNDEDIIISAGEKLSSRILAALLQDNGMKAQYIDLSSIIDFPVPEYLSQEFYRSLSTAIGTHLLSCSDEIPVITGFFGRIPGGLVASLGRGYSDLCAALVAVGLQATELQVWKEVDGIFTADPRKVPTARPLPSITPDEAGELTFYGSEVIHNFTLQQCVPKIPIRIKNVLRPHSQGTIIQPDPSELSSDPYQTRCMKKPTAVTVKEHITIVNVHSNRKVDSGAFLARICSTLEKWSLAVDLFEKNECHVSIAVHSHTPFISSSHGGENKSQIQDADLRAAVLELEEYGNVDVKQGMAILTLIGTGLKSNIGIAGRFFSALGDNFINVEMISQGASEINISCVIAEREARRALSIVHSRLITYPD